MPHDLDEATRDLHSNLSFSGGGSSGRGGGNSSRNVGSRRETPPTLMDQAVSSARQNNIASGRPTNYSPINTRDIAFGSITLGSAIVGASPVGAAVRVGAAITGVVSEWMR